MIRGMLPALVLVTVATTTSPNIIFIYADDHATAAVGCYGSQINQTPNIDRIAAGGMVFEHAFCTNAICAPARTVLLTGQHSHLNGIIDNATTLDPATVTFPALLQAAGYETAMIGKWHLRSDPVGFDHWDVLPGQGHYYAPDFRSAEGSRRIPGYVTDITTDLALAWLESDRDKDQPFMLMLHHKAPHRNWMPGPDHLGTLDEGPINEPDTLLDTWEGRVAAGNQEMTIADHTWDFYDLKIGPLDESTLEGTDKWMLSVLDRLSEEERAAWNAAYAPRDAALRAAAATGDARARLRYQRYIKDYLRCVASIDDNVGRVLDWLDESGLADDTIVIYSSDQGFFLGEHGWYDKRFMYEPSLRLPLIVRWPGVIEPGSRDDHLVQNLDLAQTFLEIAAVEAPSSMQGSSLVPLLAGQRPLDWRQSIFYEYYEPMPHAVAAHRGIRTKRWKLMHFHELDAWELFDLDADPAEMVNLAGSPATADIEGQLRGELTQLMVRYGRALP